MAKLTSWLAVDKDGLCAIYQYKPKRGNERWIPALSFTGKFSNEVFISNNTILKLVGKPLTWEDEPFELTD